MDAKENKIEIMDPILFHQVYLLLRKSVGIFSNMQDFGDRIIFMYGKDKYELLVNKSPTDD